MNAPAKHTPLPWTKQRLNMSRDDVFVYGIVGPSEIVMGLDGIVVPDRRNDRTFAEDEANIDLIIEAVNSHAVLAARVAELETANAVFDEMAEAGLELALYASYAEIVGAVSHNRKPIREWCDKVFALNNKTEEVRMALLKGGGNNG